MYKKVVHFHKTIQNRLNSFFNNVMEGGRFGSNFAP